MTDAVKPIQADALFEAIQHGDDEHRAWLKEAIAAHFAGEPVPEPRGKGRKEALITDLLSAVREARDALEALSYIADDYTNDCNLCLDGSPVMKQARAISAKLDTLLSEQVDK